MYTKRTIVDIFFGTPAYTEFRKDGELVAVRLGSEWQFTRKLCPSSVELTRAQGFKYWERHFSDRVCWSLPQPLQAALDREPRTIGEYTDRRGERIGYEG